MGQPEFGTQLRELRVSLGISQRALAERVLMSPSYFNRIERGRRPPPEPLTVIALAKELYLDPTQARQFVELADYSPTILRAGQPLAYSAPEQRPKPKAPLDRLEAALQKLPPTSRRKVMEALIALTEEIAALTPETRKRNKP